MSYNVLADLLRGTRKITDAAPDSARESDSPGRWSVLFREWELF